jgi:hypothetical protein
MHFPFSSEPSYFGHLHSSVRAMALDAIRFREANK